MRELVFIGLIAGMSGCSSARTGAIQSVRFLPEIWGEAAQKARVLYQDGALPTPVPGGTLWTFGDTFRGVIGKDGTPQFNGALSNTMAMLPLEATGWPPRLEYFADANGSVAAPLSLRSEEDEKTRRLWPLTGVWLGQGRAYMYYGLIEVTGPGPWGFKGVGTGLARAEAAFGPYERLAQPENGWPIDPSSLVRADGYLYLYAPRRFKGEKDLSSGLLVARVREGDIEDPTQYNFFSGINIDGAPRWSGRIEDSISSAEDTWGQASVAWNEHLHSYLLATSSSFFHHDEIQLRSGPSPRGPWTSLGHKNGMIKVPEREGESTQLIYCTMLHPELDKDCGRVITLTFCRMLKRDWALTNPEGLQVELAK